MAWLTSQVPLGAFRANKTVEDINLTFCQSEWRTPIYTKNISFVYHLTLRLVWYKTFN
mgnify:CR=1 FL=1